MNIYLAVGLILFALWLGMSIGIWLEANDGDDK